MSAGEAEPTQPNTLADIEVAKVTVGLPAVERAAAFAQVLARMHGDSESKQTVIAERYTLVRRLGAGGMGIVYLVHDPELDRHVALKVLHPSRKADAAVAVERRIRREARAMARLDHPNVVRVIDVDVRDGQTHLVMEYVEGTTLARWLEAEARSWQAVLRAFIGAGRGLAAAHAAGLAHCDFKPDNVLVADGGVVKVSDFGLVRTHEVAQVDTQPTLVEGRAPASAGLTATLSTGLRGTPGFMSPEQWAGDRGGPASDQFSYCVALYTALYGAPPFAGSTMAELRHSVSSGRLRALPAGRRVPAPVGRALVRGLALAPEHRWPTMDELLAELERMLGAKARRRRWAAAGLAACLVSAGAGAELHEWAERSRQIEACHAAGERAAAVWSEGARGELRARLVSSEVSYARASAERIIPLFEDRAEALREATIESCLDARVRGVWSEDMLVRANTCLDARRLELETLLAELASAQAPIEFSVSAALELPGVARCRDAPRLGAMPPLPDDRAALAAVQALESRAAILQWTGQFDAGLEQMDEARVAADALGWAPLSARTRRRVGGILAGLGRDEEAVETLADAYFLALAANERAQALAAALDLVATVGVEQRLPDEALSWARHAQALLTASGEEDARLHRAEYLGHLGAIYNADGDYERALSTQQRALALEEEMFGPEHHGLVSGLQTLTLILDNLGQLEEAKVAAERQLAISEQTFGPGHPRVSMARRYLGLVYSDMGANEEAVEVLTRALAELERAVGPNSPRIRTILENLAVAQAELERFDDAIANLERAIAITTAAHGPDSYKLGYVLFFLGAVLDASGRPSEARSKLERALEIHEHSSGLNGPEIPPILYHLAQVNAELGDHAQAVSMMKRAIATREAIPGYRPALRSKYLMALASLQRDAGATDDAIETVLRVLALLEADAEPDADALERARALLAELE